jgi:hypothetical protein
LDLLKKDSKLYITPLILSITIIPLIVFLKRIELGDNLAAYWTGAVNMDFFSYYKSVWFIFFALLGLILFFIYLSRGNKIKKTNYYIPIAVYSFFAFFSTVFSETPYTAFLGFPDRFEGLFVLLSYMLILFLAINLINDQKTLKLIIISLLIAAAVLGLQGVFQYFGLDFFQTDFGRALILPQSQHNLINQLNFEFDSNIIYSTMFNPNYVGSYTAMLFSLTLALFILIKNKQKKFFLGAVNLIMFAYWLGSLSRAGMVGGGIAVLMLLVLLKDILKANWKPLLFLALAFVAIFAGMNSYGNGNIARDILSLRGEAETLRTDTVSESEGPAGESLTEIKTDGSDLMIKTNENLINVRLEESSLKFINQEDEALRYSFNQETGEINFASEQYRNHDFSFDPENNILKWRFEKMEASYKITQNGFYIVGHNSQAYKIEEKVESWGFEGKERLGSSRGYIWSRSLPLLKDSWFLGFGADTYAINFPQKDWTGKLKAFGVTNKIVDKPHNMYLQMAINTGVPSLLAVLAILVMYFYQSIKLFWNNKFEKLEAKIGVAVLAAVLGYAVAGLFNDSIVSVAPVFWVLLGIGISINLKLADNPF